MIVYGDEPYGEHPLGGAIVQIGVGDPYYPPDEVFADSDAFKVAHPLPTTQNYILYDYTRGYETNDAYWLGYNNDPTFSFLVLQQIPDGSIGIDGFNKLDINFSLTF